MQPLLTRCKPPSRPGISCFGATWLFRLLQSAATGGYGAPILDGVVRDVSLVGMGVTWAFTANGTAAAV